MRKLILLKSLVDFIWIVTGVPAILLGIALIPCLFIYTSIFETFSILPEETLVTNNFLVQFMVLILILSFLSSMYSFYLFRKIIRYFQKAQPFDLFVINSFNKIGWILSIAGLVSSITLILLRLMLESRITIRLGATPYLIMICLGLFFMVLSETFRVAKNQKEENELTI
ncbi:DUF2975 domain-containing protein [Mesonia ostreae]|uniref:DUF2975 domain-containing protein n=1 Tax=Mesonia ostreae TaxID=861110 RepID=A0ABU2KKU8_9FLAO|nr:DUF2975 domain-containing protein [Mesonia ostreae]MDT0295283.1 DUF2975 domain-containing protein [Mesonia ostreae]